MEAIPCRACAAEGNAWRCRVAGVSPADGRPLASPPLGRRMESSSRRACRAAGRPIASPPLGRRVESSSRRACSAAGRPLAPPPLRRATAEQPSRGARAGRVVRRSKPRSQSPLAQSRPKVQDASGRRPTRQARYCSVAEPTAAERSAKQPTALEPLARPSSRATARRARAARGGLESSESISNIPLETARDHQDRDLVSR